MITLASFLAGLWVGALAGVFMIGMITVARNDDEARGRS